MFGGTNPLIDIGISMTLRDNFTKNSNSIVSGWRKMLNDMNTYQQAMQGSFMDSLNRNVAVVKGLYDTFAYSAQVQKNVFLTNKMVNDGIDHQEEFLKHAQEINLRNPLTAMDITSGQKFMAMAGMTADKIKAASEPAAQMAAIFDMQMGGKGGTADLLTNVMSTFQISADRATEISDILAVGTTSANISMTDLAQSMKYVGANAKMAGMDVKEVTAAIGVLGNYGIQGSMAGTNLGQALNTMNKAITGASEKGLNALKTLGLDPKDLQTAEGNLIPIHDLLNKIAERTEGLGGVQKQGILFNLFGQRGLRAMMPLLEDIWSGNNKFSELMSKLDNSGGWLNDTMAEYMESPQGKIDQMTSAWENLRVTAGAALSDIFLPAMKMIIGITNTINTLAGTGFGKWAIRATTLFVTFRAIRRVMSLIGFGLKSVSTGMTTASAGSTKMASGIAQANVNAIALEAHLQNITRILAQQFLILRGPGSSLPLYGATYSYSKKGVMSVYQGAAQQARMPSVMIGGIPFGAVGGGATGGAVGGAAGWKPSTTNINTGYRSIRAAMGSSIFSTATRYGLGSRAAIGITRSLSVIGAGVSRLAVLAGPWGMALSVILAFLPSIFSIFSSSKSQEQDLEAKRADQVKSLEDALRAGKTSSININVNGKAQGVYDDGDSVDVELDNEMYTNGM